MCTYTGCAVKRSEAAGLTETTVAEAKPSCPSDAESLLLLLLLQASTHPHWDEQSVSKHVAFR